ncbi:MAG: hypothetical protein IT581_10790 [Verrucomicrobiales bacterium]|nr:hypothetical protein [Verrucomicrobiales bacterium]
MKLLRPIILLAWILTPLIGGAGEKPTAKTSGGEDRATALELQRLQGRWKGVMMGHEKDGMISVTITNSSLRFYRDTNFWFETAITLPAGKDPRQLHATIKDSAPSQADSIGKVVKAFFRIEDGKLTLATIGDDTEETPKGFESADTRYEFRKAQPQNEPAEPPKTP